MSTHTAPTKKDAEPTATEVGTGTQELRIATAMTGGVSLAIWMGGVAREINLLEQASRRRENLTAVDDLPTIDGKETTTAARDAHSSRTLYLRLLDLLDLTVDVDVLSGTSAGGINAGLLGFTRSRRLDLGPLRDVWLETGSFDLLLRDPSEKSPPSLLQGDGVLLEGLRDGITMLADGGATTPKTQPGPLTDVFITTTLLSGETSRFTDTFGTLVQDVDHRGVFKFDEEQLTASEAEAALAMASRCSASFPGAFEPAYVRWGKDKSSKLPLTTHPDMSGYANTTRSHYVADGGLLMNRPLKPLLDAVFDRPAHRQVRRVLLYVVPSPGEAPDPSEKPPPEKQSTFAGALLKDVGAAINQSISVELRAIQDHNDNVEAMADARLRVAEMGAPLGLDLLRPEALADYRRRQSVALAKSTVTALMRAVTTMSGKSMPASWRTALEAGPGFELECRDAAAEAVADGWPEVPPAPGDLDGIVKFGRAPYDGAKAMAIAMLQLGWTLANSAADRDALSGATKAVHESLGAQTRPSLAKTVAAHINAIKPGSAPTLPDLAATIAGEVAGEHAELTPFLEAAWQKLATALLGAMPMLSGLASTVYSGPINERRASAKSELTTYLTYLRGPQVPAADTDTALSDEQLTIARLFQIYVVVRSMLPVAAAVEQRVDLVQVSADTRSVVAPAISTAKDKLTGMQLHHFGAFYKSSWRANDWMWGRLDGAGWLVHVLLDPRRIFALAESELPNPGGRADWFLGRLAARIPGINIDDEKIRTELAYLDDPAFPTQRSLPETSMRVAAAWQRRIAEWEVPEIARQIVANPSLRTSKWAVEVLELTNTPESIIATVRAATAALMGGAPDRKIKPITKLAAAEPPPDLSGPDKQKLVEKLCDCPVRAETLGGEIGEPLFIRTATKAVAVTAAATAEAPEIPTILKPILATIRGTTLLAYRLAALTRGRQRAIAVVGLIAFALGALLLRSSRTAFGVSGGILIAVGIYLLLFVAWRSLKTVADWIRCFLTGLVLIAAAVLFLSSSLRAELFGDGEDDYGSVGRAVISWLQDTVIPWLQDPGSHATIAVIAFVLLVASVVSLVLHRKKR